VTLVKRATLAAAAALLAPAVIPAVSHAAPLSAPDPAVQWNRIVLDLQAGQGVQPATVHPTYELAIVQTAISDAISSIDRRHTPFLADVRVRRNASITAAADAAAHDALVALYPAQKAAVDADYATMIQSVPAGPRRSRGVRAGRQVAAKVLARRKDDGSTAAPLPFQPGSAPGEYQLTPPAFGQPAFTHWPHVKPFGLRTAAQFRPPAPPALTSGKYAAAIGEVQALGASTGSTRTPDQTQIGQFWNPAIWATWNRIAQSAALSGHRGLSHNARALAALDLTFADSVIAFYDAKYAYRFWRPVTAIRATTDPAWTPLSPTAADPSYPGAHGTISAAGAEVLAHAYGNDTAFSVTSTATGTRPPVERAFTSFSEAAEEASESRIFNGNHTRLDEIAGENLGRDVAGWIRAHVRTPR
jgi:PAP2 superfamily